jgi:glycosyltransferase involved in cell wall biosynthesis
VLKPDGHIETPSRFPERPGVLFMTDSFETGGSERQFVTLARALDRGAFRVEVGCLQARGALAGDFSEIAHFPTGGSFLSLRSLKSRVALARFLRRHRIAVAQAFDFYSNLMLIPAAWLARVPVIVGSQRQIGDLLTSRQFRAQAAAFRLCDRVVANSCAAAERLRPSGVRPDRVVVIPNALPEEAFAAAAPALPREAGRLRVGMIARMNHAVKNHPGFLRAAARIAAQFPEVEFVLAGDGPLREELERLAGSLGLATRVRFLGDRRDIPAVLASLDVSVLPSFSESLPNAVLESMAAGVAVVATRVGGNPEAVADGETGLLVEPGDDARLAAAIERLLRDAELRRRCGARAKEVAREKYSLERVARRFEELYQSLLAGKPGRRARLRPAPSGAAPARRRLRVAIVAASPRWIGGHGVQAELLMRQWRDDPAVEARFIAIDPDFPRGLAGAGRIPLLRTVVRLPLYLRALGRGLRDADIVHIFSASYWSFLLAPVPAWWMARRRGKKVLINYHSGEARDHLRRWRTALPVLRRADRLVVPSPYLVEVFREFGLEATPVPNAVDLDQFRYRLRQPLRPLLLCTRGFHPYYGVDVVVRAFAQIKREFPEARLLLVGKGPSEGEVRELVSRLRLADVEFTGPVAHAEIHRQYERADVFINASWLDNLPISLLEAFASGTPVVTTAAEGIRYFVEHERTGLLSECGDPAGLARNVIRLLREPALALALSRNAREESRRYSWEAVRPQWLAVYRSLGPAEAVENPFSPEPALRV